MTAADPTFSILEGVSEAVCEARYLRDAIRAWESPAELDERVTRLVQRLRSIEALGLDVRVVANPDQGVLL